MLVIQYSRMVKCYIWEKKCFFNEPNNAYYGSKRALVQHLPAHSDAY